MGKEQAEKILRWHYKKSKDVNIVKRAHGVLLYLRGRHFGDILDVLMVSERTLERWVSGYKEDGVGSIFPGYYNNENASKLTREQKEEIKQILEDDPPADTFWSVEKLKGYISARFDIEYQSPQSYYGLLQFCNYSYKLPSTFDRRRDDQLVEKRMNEIREEINPYMKDSNVEVYAADESRIEWSTIKRRAWLRRGEKTVIKEKRERNYQSFLGLLNMKTGKEELYRLDWQDQEHIIPVLTDITEKNKGKKIVVIWDNAGFHRGREIKEQLGEGHPLENMHLIWLPPYAPDKNPQELMWKYGKDQIRNKVYNWFEKLISDFEVNTTGRLYHYNFRQFVLG